MKTNLEIRAEAKDRIALINNCKDPAWSPLDRDNALTYIGAYEEGYRKAVEDLDVLAEMRKVEASHFRTVSDTGANDCAMVVWNSLRRHLGLPPLGREDLATYDSKAEKYVRPPGSRLLPEGQGDPAPVNLTPASKITDALNGIMTRSFYGDSTGYYHVEPAAYQTARRLWEESSKS